MANATSREHLVVDYLRGEQAPQQYLQEVTTRHGNYRGFNLLLGDAKHLLYYSSVDNKIEAALPSIHGLSNRAKASFFEHSATRSAISFQPRRSSFRTLLVSGAASFLVGYSARYSAGLGGAECFCFPAPAAARPRRSLTASHGAATGGVSTKITAVAAASSVRKFAYRPCA